MPYWLLSEDLVFPHPLAASPEGILAIGGDLSLERLKLSYAYGVFPWYGKHDPIVWWFPNPRCVMKPADVVISRSLRSKINKQTFRITFDTAFERVIRHCSAVPRKGQNGTWIHSEMVDAYIAFHEAGYAHSVEVWQDRYLVGGLYGVSLGKIFFGESMFSLATDSSKYALVMLAEFLESKGFWLIDCQQDTPHVRSLGAGLIPAGEFHALLTKNRLLYSPPGKWTSVHAE